MIKTGISGRHLWRIQVNREIKEVVCTLTASAGYARNHNVRLFRTVTGDLAGHHVLYTATTDKDTFSNSLFTYRLRSFAS